MEFPLLPDLSEKALERATLQSIQRASGSQRELIPCWETGHFAMYFTNFMIVNYVDTSWVRAMRSDRRMRFLKDHVWHHYRDSAMRMYKRIMFDYSIAGEFNGDN